MVAVLSLDIGLRSLIQRATSGLDATNYLSRTHLSGKYLYPPAIKSCFSNIILRMEIKEITFQWEYFFLFKGERTSNQEKVSLPCPGREFGWARKTKFRD